MEKEIFRDIPHFEGIYQVSNYGRVKSCSRYLANGRFNEEFIMKQQKDKKGYKRITLYSKGKNVHFLVHKLVALMFIPNPYGKPQVDHIDGNKENNNVCNLRWCTNLENVGYCVEKNGRHIFTPEESKCSRLVAKLDMNGNELCVYPSLGEAHRNNPKSSISKISEVCRGKRKSSGGFKWEFRSELPECFKCNKNKGTPIPILQFDEDNNLIAKYKSINEANRCTKVHQTCIRKSLRTGYVTIEGYTFKYD